MSADFGGIARNFGGIAAISAELKIVGNFICFRQKF
jgi:hypothetical protein